MSAWLAANSALLGWLAVVSAVGFVATLVAVPFIIIRMPSDYFVRRPRPLWSGRHLLVRCLCRLATNALGLILLAAGIAMLVLPGQGLLTMLFGLMLLDFPGKRACERWLVTRPAVHLVIGKLRARAGREPLDLGVEAHCD